MHYGVVVATLTVFLVGGPSGFLVLRSFFETREHVTTLANAIFREVSRSLVARSRSLLALAPPTLSVLAGQSPEEAREDELEALSRRLVRVLEAGPGFDRLEFGARDGTFLGLHHRDDGVVERTRVQIVDGERVETTDELLPSGPHVLAQRRSRVFDPRTRPWYVAAERTKRRVWVRPYVFAEGDSVGVTCAMPLFDAEGGVYGVFGADYELASLSRFAKRLAFSEHARVLVATPDGDLVAQSWTETPTDGGGLTVPRVERFRDVQDPLMSAFRDSSAALGPVRPDEQSRHVDFLYDGDRWHGSVTGFEVEPGIVWYVGALAPEEDFLGPVILENRVQTLAGLVGLLVAVAVAVVLSKRLTRPIVDLTAAMERVENLDLEGDQVRIRSRFLEIDRMGLALDRMRIGLASFARFVPRDLVRTLVNADRAAGLGGEVRDLTVFFSDVAGFTSIAEDLPPDELVRRLGRYLEVVTDTITEHRGTVDKYLGDGVMAFWGAPLDDPGHAAHALVAALVIERRLTELGRSPEGAWMHGAVTRMGLASGPVLVGTIGTPDVMNYTVMGDVANLASRLESLSKQYGTRLLASEAAVNAAGDAVIARPVDLVAVKGKRQGVRVHELLGLPTDPDADAIRERAALTAASFERYLARDFATALTGYDQLLATHPDDPVAQRMRDRCRDYLGCPPPTDWTGIHVAQTK